MKLAFLGFGTIGRIIYSEILSGKLTGIIPIAVLDPQLNEKNILDLKEKGVKVCNTLDEIIDQNPDFIIEAANQKVAAECTPKILAKDINVISLSVGAYLNEDVMDKVINNSCKGKLYISSGAMPCIDAIKGANVRKIDSVKLTTRKNPKSLAGAPGMSNIDIDNLSQPRVVFDGNAWEAVRLFPKNVNIAATISLAGVGPLKTKVTIIADPDVKYNIHQISISGEFGNYNSTIECLPSSNPKTSLMAALSVIALLKDLGSNVHIGS